MVSWQRLLERTNHRPWPIPGAPWVMTMSWLDLLFAHWSVEPEALRPLVPEPLELETFEGRAWLGVVPFRMEAVGPRGLGWLPASWPAPRSFPELNVRTYVEHEGKPGVWFLSLDAASRLAVWGARRFFHLPYFHARMSASRGGDWVEYRSRREDPRLGAGDFSGRYAPVGERLDVRPGSLEHWLTERYCLYARAGDGKVLRGEIHHPPWPLYAARAEISTNTVTAAHGVRLQGEPLLHFAPRLDVVAWILGRLDAGVTGPRGGAPPGGRRPFSTSGAEDGSRAGGPR